MKRINEWLKADVQTKMAFEMKSMWDMDNSSNIKRRLLRNAIPGDVA